MNVRQETRFVVRVSIAILLVVLAARPARAADTIAPPPPAKGDQFSIAVLPDPQAYTQSYDITKGRERWGGKGYQYKDRLDQQVQWIVDNRVKYNIRFAVSVGDNVQHFGYNAKKARNPRSYDAKVRGEWLNAQRSFNLFHKDADPTKPAALPYAIACGNHDYHFAGRGSLDSREYDRFFGPGRWRDAKGDVRAAFAGWYKGDDKGWVYRVNRGIAATGVGRNSCQTFTAGGRTFLHLTLECGATDQAIAWARTVLKQNPGKPTILTTHAFISGGGKWLTAERMGRNVKGGRNPTNSARGVWDKLIKDNDQIFLILCGHTWSQKHVVARNAAGHDVHIMEACYHLNYAGGRIKISQKPADGWAYEGKTDDFDRNGSGWMRLMLFDPAKGRIAAYTYSPTLGLWAANRKPDDRTRPDGQDGVWWNRTFPVGDDVVDQFKFDFRARFGPAR